MQQLKQTADTGLSNFRVTRGCTPVTGTGPHTIQDKCCACSWNPHAASRVNHASPSQPTGQQIYQPHYCHAAPPAKLLQQEQWGEWWPSRRSKAVILTLHRLPVSQPWPNQLMPDAFSKVTYALEGEETLQNLESLCLWKPLGNITIRSPRTCMDHTWQGTCTKNGQAVEKNGQIDSECHRLLLNNKFLKNPCL